MSDSPNNGDEYKAWLTPVEKYDAAGTSCWRSITPGGGTGGDFGFCDSDSKTDNFKVRSPAFAYVKACKFHDVNGDRVQNGTEELLSGWKITANNVVAGGSNSTVESRTTDSTGCVTFTVLPGGSPVTMFEWLQSGWIQTAPSPGSYADYTVADVSGSWVVTVKNLSATDNVEVDFGNNNLSEDQRLTVTKNVTPLAKYKWGITKDVDKTTLNIADGGTATFNYTVNVTHEIIADSGKVSGDISIVNGLSVDVAVTVSDDPANGGSCTITPDSNGTANADGSVAETIPHNSTVKLTYVCTFPTVSSATKGTNTVTVKQSGTLVDDDTETYDFAGATAPRRHRECGRH